MLASTRRMYHIARVLIRYRLHEYLPDEGAFRWLRLAARLHPASYQDDGDAASYKTSAPSSLNWGRPSPPAPTCSRPTCSQSSASCKTKCRRSPARRPAR